MERRAENRENREILAFLLLFLAAMNFGAKFFYFVLLALLTVLVRRGCLEFDGISVLHLLLCAWMGVYNIREGFLSVLRCFAPFCFYLVGLNLVSDPSSALPDFQKGNNAQRQGYGILAVISLGSFAHYVLNFLYNFGASMGRNTNDIWTGSRMAATGQNALTSLMLGLACAVIFLPTQKWHRWGGIASILLIVAYNMVLSCRTMLAMLAILLFLGMLYPRKDIKYGTQLLRCLVWVLILGGAAFALYQWNVGGIRDLIRSSTLFSRLGGSLNSLTDNDSRQYAKKMFLSQMGKYPFGGCHMRSMYNYAHDLLLDAYDEYGIVVFAMLTALLAVGLVQLYRLIRRTGYDEPFKLMALLISCGVLLEFMMEPILVGMPWLFSCYCLINGCIVGMNRTFFTYGMGAKERKDESITDQYGVRPGQYRNDRKVHS